MKKEITYVPNIERFIDSIEKIGAEGLKCNWIFIHENLYRKITKNNAVSMYISASMTRQTTLFIFKNMDITMVCEAPPSQGWGRLISYQNRNKSIHFKNDPEEIDFFKLESKTV